MADILERILARKREELEAARVAVPLAQIEERARSAPPPRDFAGALRARIGAGRPAVIAEIKKASPSKGLLRADFDPAAIARSYEAGGAACLSVLTDRDFFQGAHAHLVQARTACALPVLRKDFITEPYQVYESRALGADCILLIAAALARQDMQGSRRARVRSAWRCWSKVHDAAELESALALHTPLIGINNRTCAVSRPACRPRIDLLRAFPRGGSWSPKAASGRARTSRCSWPAAYPPSCRGGLHACPGPGPGARGFH